MRCWLRHPGLSTKALRRGGIQWESGGGGGEVVVGPVEIRRIRLLIIEIICRYAIRHVEISFVSIIRGSRTSRSLGATKSKLCYLGDRRYYRSRPFCRPSASSCGGKREGAGEHSERTLRFRSIDYDGQFPGNTKSGNKLKVQRKRISLINDTKEASQ